jgi:hypothetical protein
MDTLTKLIHWYASNCNGDWEHGYGVKIDTLDNPGWSVDIDLTETPLDGRIFQPITIERSDTDWVFCKVEKGRFCGAGGVDNLIEILDLFFDWNGKEGPEACPDSPLK